MNENDTEYVPVDIEFRTFNKLARLNREIVITEKIDGTNAQVLIATKTEFDAGIDRHLAEVTGMVPYETARNDKFVLLAGSRNRWITPQQDNYGFARWCRDNSEELLKLGTGRHFGEWWGNGVQRGYGLKEKRFSLFNVGRWSPCSTGPGIVSVNSIGETTVGPSCCSVVPILWRGMMGVSDIHFTLEELRETGSIAAPGFMDPEGIVIYHTAQGNLFKVTLKNDESPKSLVK